MKKFFISLAICISTLLAHAQVSQKAFNDWHSSKFSMFIHFGIYSELGGVWDGKPVKWGYSEQIQSFAGIFSDWYGETAKRFNPTRFNADSIVILAKEAGMHSIVITTKHHDGFCMFKTATTDYNSYDATPCKRDFVKELADACKRNGLKLGLYFSVIDWHYPHAYPISSHNCDFVTPQHHDFSKKQITELLTNYGPISELWFDMGSNTPEQSAELYALVHKLQPNCMVSGRLGNDRYDFAVMADNAYPETALQCPWQSAASMFKETWSYRSWQERGEVNPKVTEKLHSLINVVSHGGNFLLNIGPKGDGSVVPFEKEVLLAMGAWLKKNGYAIYGTEASPFRENFTWGAITRKDNMMYLILSGLYPQGGIIRLNMPDNKLENAEGNLTEYRQQGNIIEITIPQTAYDEQNIQVISLKFTKKIEPQLAEAIPGNRILTSANATPDYSYSCFDYYSNYRSTVSYTWNVKQSQPKSIEFLYTEQEQGKTIDLTFDGKTYPVKLDNGKKETIPTQNVKWGKLYLCGPGQGAFDDASKLSTDLQTPPARCNAWQEITQNEGSVPSRIRSTYYLMQEIESPKEQNYLIEVGAGNGVEVYLNGQSIMKHLNPYRCTYRTEKVLLPLKKGKNQIVVRLFNRFEKEVHYSLRPTEQTMFRQHFKLPYNVKGKTHNIRVRQAGLPSQHTDTELANLRLQLR